MKREAGLTRGHQGHKKDSDWKRRGVLAGEGSESWQGPHAREGVPQGTESTCEELWEDPLEEEAAAPPVSCPENPLDRGAWRATVHGVAESGVIERAARRSCCLLIMSEADCGDHLI